MSLLSTVVFGARQLNHQEVERWAQPVLDAFLAGCWFLYWTDDTLYWVAKPTLHKDSAPGTRRLHHDTHAALESDCENLYFVHGVLVPAFVVVKPEWITVQHIQQETNAEVRRVMLDRFGFDRFITAIGAMPLHADDTGSLYQCALTDDEPLTIVRVTNSAPESDGSYKHYALRVHPELRPLPPGEWTEEKKAQWVSQQAPQAMTARNAVASLHGLRGEQYAPQVQA